VDDIPLYVKKQGGKLQKWVMAHNYICVDFNDKKPFANINNKDDLALIENA
jgi:molybdopterin-guanine dinucleotide biosynthesis protein A